MDPLLVCAGPVGVMVWLKGAVLDRRFRRRAVSVVEQASQPADASTASRVAVVKVADGWVAYVRPPSVVMTLWMRT